MLLSFSAPVIEWRGPSPYVFAPVPQELTEEVRRIARELSYGWGVVPVRVRVGASVWTTSLFPRDGGYLVPLRGKERTAEGIQLGDVILLELGFGEG